MRYAIPTMAIRGSSDTRMLASVQMLRALAAWMVVGHHVQQTFYDFRSTSLVGWLFTARGSAGVEIFFAISGFVMVLSTHGRPISGAQFLLRRLARIVPSYWIF